MHKIQPQTDAQRIAALLDYTHLNGKNFALRIGLRYPDSIYHIQRGRNGISDKLADRIVILTNTPTHIKQEVRVDLPRPRSYSDPAFLAIRRQIEDLCDDTL